MRSDSDDRSTPAVIRDAALTLFAAQDSDAVSVRRIAAEAGVSPALVLHHFGSKAGLVEAVEAYVLGIFDDLIGDLVTEVDATDVLARVSAQDDTSLRAFYERVGPHSPVIDYLRRTLVAGGDGARRLVRHWYELTVQILTDYRDQGLIDVGSDLPMRAAQLLMIDLGMIVLRPIWTELLGSDPLADGAERWTRGGYEFFALMLTDAPEQTEQTEPSERIDDTVEER